METTSQAKTMAGLCGLGEILLHILSLTFSFYALYNFLGAVIPVRALLILFVAVAIIFFEAAVHISAEQMFAKTGTKILRYVSILMCVCVVSISGLLTTIGCSQLATHTNEYIENVSHSSSVELLKSQITQYNKEINTLLEVRKGRRNKRLNDQEEKVLNNLYNQLDRATEFLANQELKLQNKNAEIDAANADTEASLGSVYTDFGFACQILLICFKFARRQAIESDKAVAPKKEKSPPTPRAKKNPRTSINKKAEIVRLMKQNPSWTQADIARELGINKSTVSRALNEQVEYDTYEQ